MARLKPHMLKGLIEAGTDEVGRGCLAGPVVAAAVILRPRRTHPYLNDSKKMSAKRRDELFEWVKENSLAYAISAVDNNEIDRINILQASFLAMHRALDKLEVRPEHILVDGNRFLPYHKTPHSCVIKGDGIYRSIAAASVLAKVYRDRYMSDMAEKYPGYGWENNVGYPTRSHREGISLQGVTPLHRLTFRMGVETD